MESNPSDRSASAGSRRLLVSSSIADDEFGDRHPIVAAFPGHVDDAAGIAALVEGAAADAGVTFDRFLQRIRAEAPPLMGRGGRVPLAAHRPGFDWKTKHGASLVNLWAIALRHRMACPEMTKTAASGAALQEARKSAKMSRLSLDAEKTETARLKQAWRHLPAHELARGKADPSISSRFPT